LNLKDPKAFDQRLNAAEALIEDLEQKLNELKALLKSMTMNNALSHIRAAVEQLRRRCKLCHESVD
jgi:glutaredoxin 2